MAQINYVSRNQLHCKANLNFGLMYKKAKHCWGLSTNFLFLISWYLFLIMFCFLLNWRKNSNYFNIAVWQSESNVVVFNLNLFAYPNFYTRKIGTIVRKNEKVDAICKYCRGSPTIINETFEKCIFLCVHPPHSRQF